MNDGQQPKRNVFTYILPYILMAITVALFVWLIVSQTMGTTNVWSESNLDTYIGAYSTTTSSWVVDADGAHGLKNATVSQGYKAVTVTGTYFDKNNSERSYSVLIEENKWNADFEATYTDSNKQVVTYTHASYAYVFNSVIAKAKAGAPATSVDQYYVKVTDAFQVSWWDTWGPTIIMIGVVTILGIIFFIRLNGSVNGANRQAMDFNKSPARREDASKVRFSDVAGCDEEKAEMVELVEYLKDPKKYSKFGARLPKGVLLIGPPGTGKTLLAKAVAGEAKVPFYSISGSDFVEMFVGVGAGRVRDLFKRAKQTAPCLIFIDEIDAVGRQRGAGLGGGNDEREQTLNQLLVEMDGFEANTGILVIAATNRDDVLDPALLRAGRFDRTITVNLPDRAGREAIFKVHARNKKIDPSVSWDALARRTVGFSGADIENILNEAAILAVRENKDQVDLADIDEAIDRRIAGPAKSGKGMNAQERREVAYHEAGHAIIGLNLPYSEKVQKITIIPRGRTGGHVLMTPEDDRFLLTKRELIAQITGLLGGRTSEEIFFDDVSTGAQNDIEEATRLARLMVTEFGMSDLGPIQYEKDTGSVFLGRDYANTQRNFSTQIAFEIDKAVRQIIDEAHEQARKVITEHKDEVKLIAETLLQKETITAEEIDSLVKTGKLPAKPVDPLLDKVEAEDNKAIAEGKDPNAVNAPAPKAEDKPADPKPADKPADPKPADVKPVAAPKKKAAPKKDDKK
jgi:cell division protease FtsH